ADGCPSDRELADHGRPLPSPGRWRACRALSPGGRATPGARARRVGAGHPRRRSPAMKRTHLRAVAPALPGLLALATPSMLPAAAPPLIVVEDLGGAPAQPYYQALGLTPRAAALLPRAQHERKRPFTESDLLPVHSTRLTPGLVEPRVRRAPGLLPGFLIGGGARPRDWRGRPRAPL